MEHYTPAEAKDMIEELVARAARGEDVRIGKVNGVTVKLMPVDKAPEVTAKRITDSMPPFVPLEKDRELGRLAGKMQVPARLMEPMSEEELRDWYGDDV